MCKLVSNQICPHLTLQDALWGLAQIPYLASQKPVNFSEYFGTSNYLLTNSARTALAEIIKVTKPDKKKRIGIPAFICAVVAVPFIEAGYKIEWLETDANGLLDYDDFTKKSAKISVLICPHIFGQTLNLKKFADYCQKKNIFLIEDGAHAWTIGSEVKHADARILSFGREKVHSCVSGGALLWNEQSKFSADFLKLKLPPANISWTLKHLFQPLIFSLALPWWIAGGKVLPWLAQKTKLLPLAVSPKEKNAHTSTSTAGLSVPLQRVLRRNIKKFADFSAHQKAVSQAWKKTLKKLFPQDQVIIPDNNFRVILKTNQAEGIKARAKSLGFLLREWDGVPISPAGVNLKKFGYEPGQCKTAEKYAGEYVTFPTNIRTTVKDVERFERNYL